MTKLPKVVVPHGRTPVFEYLNKNVRDIILARKGKALQGNPEFDAAVAITSAYAKVSNLAVNREGITYEIPAVLLMDSYWTVLKDRIEKSD